MKIEHYDNLGAPGSSQELSRTPKGPQMLPRPSGSSKELPGTPKNSKVLSNF